MRKKEFVMDEEVVLIDLGDAKEETRFGFWIPPTDAINEFRF
jgi:hypothetical protein